MSTVSEEGQAASMPCVPLFWRNVGFVNVRSWRDSDLP